MHDLLATALSRACLSAGIEMREVPQDGQWHRTDVTNDPHGRGDGSIRLFPDGEGGQVVNWKNGAEPYTFFVDRQASRPSGDALVAQQRRREEQRRSNQRAADERHALAAQMAKAVRQAASPATTEHRYLQRKMVEASATLFVIDIEALTLILGYTPKSSGEALTGSILVVPVKTDGKLATLELIDEHGRKAALAGGKKSGGFWMTERLPESPESLTLILAEGVATALSLQQGSGYPAVAALSCHNLRAVAEALREAYPSARLIIAADLGNGQQPAQETARHLNVPLAIPRFSAEQINEFTALYGKAPTDFNDLHQIAGLPEVGHQIREALTKEDIALATFATLATPPWPEPQALGISRQIHDYPVDALPAEIRAAVLEVQRFTQSPIAMVACSALSVLSVASQGLINVQRAAQLLGPISLFFLIIADSGERKSSNDGYFSDTLRRFEREETQRLAPVLAEYRADLARWEAKRSGLIEAIKRASKTNKTALDQEEALADLESDAPVPPWTPRLLYSDTTSEALTHGLARHWPSAGLLSSEAGGVLGSHGMRPDSVMRYFSILNELWDGKPLRFDRRTVESYCVPAARLTVCFQVQEPTLRSFLVQTKGLARGTGFLARFLIAYPPSTQGTRLFRPAPEYWPAVDAFHRRVAALLAKELPITDRVLTPRTVPLSPAAAQIWEAFHNQIEQELAPAGALSEMRDLGAKAADNAARLAGVFHAFSDADGDSISEAHLQSAVRIVAWHLSEAQRFLEEVSCSPEQSQSRALDQWLLRYCARENTTDVPLSLLMQRGPHGLRKREKLLSALLPLEQLDRVRILNQGRSTTICVNPRLLPPADQ